MIRRRTLLLSAAALPLAVRDRPASAQGARGPAAAPAARPPTSLGLAPLQLPVRAEDTPAQGLARDVLVRWGDRVTADARPWDPRRPSAEAAETQFGWDARICGLVPQPVGADGIVRAVLAVAHPTVDPAMAFPGGRDRPEVAAALQGASLLNLEKQGRRWLVADGGYQARRLTANTLTRMTGPAAEVTGGAVRGMLAVSGGCVTPWGTLLLAEDTPGAWLTRLRGLDARFAEGEGFGWVAELDPMDPTIVPAKRSALGNFAHGDVAATLGRDGRPVVYMTDRRGAGYLLRFASRLPAGAPDALDSGTLSVARVEGDRVRWLDLPEDRATVMDTAAAAGRRGGTTFDRPSGLAVSGPGPLLMACRGAAGSSFGHVLEFQPASGDHAAEAAGLLVLMQGRLPGRFANLPTTWPENPDTVSLDPAGRAWIGTDRGGRVGAAPDGLFACDREGAGRGLPLPAYGAPRAAGIGDAAFAPDGSAVFVAVRTPGAEPGASWDRVSTRWPAFDPALPPRSAIIALTRAAGGPMVPT